MSGPDYKELDAFYDAHQEKLFGFILRMGLAFQDAEDAVNECFLAILPHWLRIRDGNPRAYLYVTARNEVYKRWNAGRRRLEDLVWDLPAVPGADFAQEVAERDAIRWALLDLTEREREAVLLRYYAGFTVAETAMIMDDIAEGTVKRFAFDGRNKLSRALSDDARSDPGKEANNA
jgi:RNA polymerase sigma-70 factor (ECF subfamily)